MQGLPSQSVGAVHVCARTVSSGERVHTWGLPPLAPAVTRLW